MENGISEEYIRWFFKPAKYENLNSSIERFSGCDSIRIEKKYQEFCKNSTVTNSKLDVREGMFEIDLITRTCTPIYWNWATIPKVPKSNLWRSAVVQRGLWFRTDNWQPLEENESNAIEDIYVKQILILKNRPVPDNKKNHVKTSLNFNSRYYRFLLSGEVYLDTNATAHYFRKKYSMSDGILLSRGYNERATMENEPSEVSHLVFIAHGIGQSLGSITWDCIRLRETCSVLQKKYFTDRKGRLEFLPVEWRTNLQLNEEIIRSVTVTDCQPLRAYLNSTALDIMYYTSSIQRMEIMKAFYHEILRLFNLFCKHNPDFTRRGGKVSVMAHSLGAVVAFDVLTASTPMYSNIAYIHSLQKMSTGDGGDCDLISQYIRLAKKERKLLAYTPTPKDTSEQFGGASFPKVENLFCLGSPLGVFLALRGVQPMANEVQSSIQLSDDEERNSNLSNVDKSTDFKMVNNHTHSLNRNSRYDESYLHNGSANFRLFNIFHPCDPVAYRLEPLILKHYANILPAVIGNPKLLRVPDLPKSPPTRPMEDSFGFVEKPGNKLKFSKSTVNSASSIPKSLGIALNALGNYLKKSQPPGIESLFDEWERSADGMRLMPSPLERHLKARIDFQLEAEEPTVQNLLVHVFTSHSNYWTNEAMCIFLISQIFGEAPKFTTL